MSAVATRNLLRKAKSTASRLVTRTLGVPRLDRGRRGSRRRYYGELRRFRLRCRCLVSLLVIVLKERVSHIVHGVLLGRRGSVLRSAVRRNIGINYATTVDAGLATARVVPPVA